MFASRFFTLFTAAIAGISFVGSAVAEPLPVLDVRQPGSGGVNAVAHKRLDLVETQVTVVLTVLQTAITPTLSSIGMY